LEAYSSFAQVYDLFMDNVPYEEWSRYLISLLKEYQVTDGTVVELGCGTGKMTRLLADAGYDMVGVDNSAAGCRGGMQEDKGERPMNVYKTENIGTLIKGNPYVGRGIIAGLSEDGRYAVGAYFIMGRSANSRNRIFAERDGAVFTEPFDPSKVEDPSLIIYAAVREHGSDLIITNGDQTDTIVSGLEQGLDFSGSLRSRCFEPDAPNLTPRISAMLCLGGDYRYDMSILKSIDEDGSDCARYTFSYPAKRGLGHFIHTYVTDGDPLPTFQGEPERVRIPNGIDAFTDDIWNALDEDNRISLYVRYTDLTSGEKSVRLINRNK